MQGCLPYALTSERHRTLLFHLTLHILLQESMASMAREAGGAHVSVSRLNNVLMQMRKNCNHHDLIKAAFDGRMPYPSAEELRSQCGKFQLLDRLLTKLSKGGHKVLIFSQASLFALGLSAALTAACGCVSVKRSVLGAKPDSASVLNSHFCMLHSGVHWMLQSLLTVSDAICIQSLTSRT